MGTETGGSLYTIGGAGQDCSTRYVAYANDGSVTASTNDPIDVWFLTPDDRDEVNGPGERKARPCKNHIVGLTSLDLSRALAVCADGAAMSTTTSGRTWRQVARVPGTLAVAAGSGRYWLAGAVENCDGIAIRSLTVVGSASSRGLSRCAAANRATPGDVALDIVGDAIWVWAGSLVQVSINSGRSWE